MALIEYTPRKFSPESLLVIERANSIMAAYIAKGFDLTLRQLYYQFVARDCFPEDRRWVQAGGKWVRSPSGTPNAEPNYKWLGSIINDARLAGLVDWDTLKDRTRSIRELGHWSSPRQIIAGASQGYRVDLWRGQPERVEVWIEKDALIGVIEGVCQRWDVPHFSCRGYVSQSEMWEASQRLMRHKEEYEGACNEITIIHLGDHDPSGIDMTRDIEDRLTLFFEHHDHIPPTVRRVALSMAQIRQFNPPPNPAKETDSRSKDYRDKYGDESWELDSMDPQFLVDLVDTEIQQCIQEPDIFERRRNEITRGRKQLENVYNHWDVALEAVRDHLQKGEST